MSSLNCPRCHSSLAAITANGVEVDICRNGCGGVWFDEKEYKKFDEASEDATPLLLTSPSGAAPASNDVGPAMSCPKCGEDGILARRASGPDDKITIDQCMRCSGIWFDVGELGTYRAQFKTEDERETAADSFLAPAVDTILDQIEEENKRVKTITERYKNAVTVKQRLQLVMQDAKRNFKGLDLLGNSIDGKFKV